MTIRQPLEIDIEAPIEVLGLALITTKASKYGLRAGYYPIIYFEERCVQVAIEDEYDFLYISREDMQWIQCVLK